MTPRVLATLLAALALLALSATSAGAVDLEDFDVALTNAEGEEAMAAGEHPFAMRVSFKVAKEDIGGKPFPVEAVKDLRIEQMTGLTGTVVATLRCASADFLQGAKKPSATAATGCPDSSVLGTVSVEVGEEGGTGHFVGAVYNLQPAPGYVAKLGFSVAGVRVTVDIGLSEAYPYRVFASIPNITQALEFFASDLVLWGDPAAKVHDPYRGECLEGIPAPGGVLKSSGEECPAGVPNAAFLVNPRACEGPLATLWQTTSWDNPALAPVTGSAFSHDILGNPRGFSGCAELPFGPSLDVQPSAHSASSASGLQVDIGVSDGGLTDPQSRAASDMKKVVVTFPRGMTLNPSQAEGLDTCTEADLARESPTSAPGEGCPQESKVGTVEAETPLLPEETFKGELFVATPYENPFGSLIAVYMTIKDPERGVGVTVAGKVTPDPVTGQVVATFGDPSSSNPAFRALPQLPVSSVRVHLREGGRSPMITPPGCGPATTTAEFTSWADPGSARSESSTFQIDSGLGGGPCPAGVAPFHPGFEAGTENNAAKAFSPFDMRLTRRDGEQDMTKFSAILPPGVGGILRKLTRCPDAAIAAARSRTSVHGGREEIEHPSCPASARIGSTLAGAGVGSQLLYVPGSLYLAGPFGGDPLSVVAITPAVAGPFDAGTVVVRVALTLNPITGEVEADGSRSDPIPHILQGIPLNVRELRVNTDRPEFTYNATSCDPSLARATLWGGGTPLLPLPETPATLSARYQAASCASLGFKPKLAMTLKGGVRRGAHPALRVVVTPRPKDANFARAVVTLPHSAFLDQAHIRTICTRVQFNAGGGNGERCPAGSVYGHVKVWTPILNEPVQGPVILRSSNHNLPDLVFALQGPPEAAVKVEVATRIDSRNGGIRASLERIPDFPVSRFVLEMRGGKKGLIINSTNLCRSKNRIDAELSGQNGRLAHTHPVLKATGCKSRASTGARPD